MRFAFLIPPMMLLAACGQDEKAADSPDISINADGDNGGKVQITSGKDGGKIKIGGVVIAAGAEPLRRVASIALLRPEVELYGHFQMVHAVAVAQ